MSVHSPRLIIYIEQEWVILDMSKKPMAKACDTTSNLTVGWY